MTWQVKTDTEKMELCSHHRNLAAAWLRAVLDFYILYPRDFPSITRGAKGRSQQDDSALK